MPNKKRRRKEEEPKIHPKNKYSNNPPDFSLLASLYPTFKPFVFYTRDGRPRIDWTDFNDEPSYFEEGEGLPSSASEDKSYSGPPILLDVVKDGETFDFCMCNPPFFESIEQAGLIPKTACGGTSEDMVCSGGELAFITRIIEDSVVLKQSFRLC